MLRVNSVGTTSAYDPASIFACPQCGMHHLVYMRYLCSHDVGSNSNGYSIFFYEISRKHINHSNHGEVNLPIMFYLHKGRSSLCALTVLRTLATKLVRDIISSDNYMPFMN